MPGERNEAGEAPLIPALEPTIVPPLPRDRPGVAPALRRRGLATPGDAADAGGDANPPGVVAPAPPPAALAGVAPKVGPGEAKEKLTPLVAVLVAAVAVAVAVVVAPAVGVWTGAGAAAVPAEGKLNPPPVDEAPAAGVGEPKLKPDIAWLGNPWVGCKVGKATA